MHQFGQDVEYYMGLFLLDVLQNVKYDVIFPGVYMLSLLKEIKTD